MIDTKTFYFSHPTQMLNYTAIIEDGFITHIIEENRTRFTQLWESLPTVLQDNILQNMVEFDPVLFQRMYEALK